MKRMILGLFAVASLLLGSTVMPAEGRWNGWYNPYYGYGGWGGHRSSWSSNLGWGLAGLGVGLGLSGLGSGYYNAGYGYGYPSYYGGGLNLYSSPSYCGYYGNYWY